MRSGIYDRFLHDTAGNISLLFGLGLVGIVGTSGAAIDYGRMSAMQTAIGASADAAALAGAKAVGETFAIKKEIAEREYLANMAGRGFSNMPKPTVTDLTNGIRVEASVTVKHAFMSMLMSDTRREVKALAEATLSPGGAEIALVLDTTGSMRDDMPALRDAATSFTNSVMSVSSGSNVKVSVVPYVGAVNPGRSNLGMSYMDTGADSKWHGQTLRNWHFANVPNCNWGTGWGTPTNPGTGKPGASLQSAPSQFADAARAVLGISSAKATAIVTPNTIEPLSGTTQTVSAPHVASPVNVFVPTGFNVWNPCGLFNPSKVSHFDLFNRLGKNGVSWKGCVEARPEPFDVTIDPPDMTKPDTLFVPYFWPDEPDTANGWKYVNTYTQDGKIPAGYEHNWDWGGATNLLKYDGKTPPGQIKETSPDTSGPNRACPNEVTPLTSDKTRVLGEIAKLSHWDGSGTISSEGLMWGWRTLHPGAPFNNGMPYHADNRKYIILMSDGENMIGAQEPLGPRASEYSAYGYLRNGRFPAETYASAETYLNDRMKLACANAKAQGVRIITILFRVNTQATIDLMKNCATSPSWAYRASDGAALKLAFQSVAGEISKLRLSR